MVSSRTVASSSGDQPYVLPLPHGPRLGDGTSERMRATLRQQRRYSPVRAPSDLQWSGSVRIANSLRTHARDEGTRE